MIGRRKRVAAALGIGGIVAVAGHAFAADLRISVTGSNIKRSDTETAAPIEVITREDIQATGLQTISDVLRQITANNNGSVSPSFTNGFSTSGSAVSLRGLGPNNTLVLLNGRRVANFGLADDAHASYVDLQQIPFDAVERIEVLKDGASAIYGSDAVAGVVNVILRQQFSGVTATATVGTTYNGEGDQYKAALTVGIGDLTKDRYNVFLTVDGQRQQAIPANRGRQYAGTNDLRFMGLIDARPGSPTPIPTIPLAFASQLGNVRPVSAANPNGPAGPFQPLPGDCAPADQDGAFCRWDVKDHTDLQPEVQRLNVFARGTVAFSEAIHGYAELSLFDVKTSTRGPAAYTRTIWADPSTDTVVSSQNVFLPVGHPDNPFNASDRVARLYYIDAGLGSRNLDFDTTTQRYLAGVKGTTAGWDWDLAGLYIRSDTESTRGQTYSYDRLLQGLAGTGPYGYYRIGASAAQNDPAIYDWIAPTLQYTTVSENTVFDAKASRDLHKLDGGQLALAVGYEYRKEELRNPGIPGTDTGNVVGLNYTAAFGSRTVNALYAELYAPLLRNLEVTGAVRVDDYSDFGSTTNPKVGVKWTVVPQLALRGTWQSAFRAPGLYESGDLTLAGPGAVRDPVRCPVTGSAADCGNGLSVGLFKGDPNLEPETSTTYTLGIILEPVPGLSATLDYWHIETRNQIAAPDAQVVVDHPSNFPGAVVGRDTNDLPGIPNSGTIVYVQTPLQNVNSVLTDGIDVDIRWKLDLQDWGRLTTQLQWTHIFQYTQTFEGGLSFDFVGTQGPYGVSSAAGTPQDRANFIVGWQRGPWNVTGTVRYVSDYLSVLWQGAKETEGCLSVLDGPDCHVASFTTLDLSAAYSGFKNWQIFGSIINVFNRMPPFNPAAAYSFVNYNYNYAFSGATGTQFNLGVRYSFE